MATIIEYSDTHPPTNQHPLRIVSPRSSHPCCATSMEDVGSAVTEGRWVLKYRRCRRCGFAVRLVVRALADADEVDASAAVAHRA
jgi:hypothetical protein